MRNQMTLAGLLGAVALLFHIGVALGAEATISIDNFTFEPARLKIAVGTTVKWTNRDDIPHTVVSVGKFKSAALDTDDSFSYTFTTVGNFSYFCSLHPHMTGTIEVE